MIFQTGDATWANWIVNKPAVRSTFGLHLDLDPALPIDLSDFATLPGHRLITNGEDAFICVEERSPSAFQLHIVFDEGCRGSRAIEQGKAMIDWLFQNTRAKLLFGNIPVENKKARMFCRLVGCESDGIATLNHDSGSYLVEHFNKPRPVTDR